MSRINRTACSSFNRLSKATFLAMLGPPPDAYSDEEQAILNYYNEGMSVAEIAETTGLTNKNVRDFIRQVTQPRNSSHPSRAFFEKIDDSDWSITSFDPSTRTVCVQIAQDTGTRTVTVILPALVAK